MITTNEEINDTLYHLSRLDLHGNNLINISSEVMDGFIETNALLYLDLSNNKLSDLPDNIPNLTSVRTLKISENKFKCSCKSFWMKEWLLSKTQVVEDFENIKCEMKSGKRIPIVHMDKTDMGCVPITGESLSTWQIAGKYLFVQILNVEFLLNEATLTGPFLQVSGVLCGKSIPIFKFVGIFKILLYKQIREQWDQTSNSSHNQV